MATQPATSRLSRRQLLRRGVALTGTALVAPMIPSWLTRAFAATLQPATAQAPDQLALMRAQMGAVPIEIVKLTDRLTMLSGPGGNVVVSMGTDGKVMVDCFVQPAWPALSKTLDGIGKAPVKTLIDTHWHFDHADNNENLGKVGAAILAHENTKTRLGQAHEILGAKFPPSPAGAMPTQTFKDGHTIEANGEQIVLAWVPPAHTDTDITVRFTKSNVVHLGDLFFNGMYPFIDASTGGRINGMINAADAALKMVDGQTKIVPGHGPLGDRASLTKYRDMMATIRDRVQKLKGSGRTLDETIAANPSKDFDPVWGKGFMDPKSFLTIVYNTL